MPPSSPMGLSILNGDKRCLQFHGILIQSVMFQAIMFTMQPVIMASIH